ncbi:MAG: D-2-hydroxyacid dehydrogenase family protein [Betaproteobacteria bacterium]|nr:D-2-hydroxyacid dehydrogenase family protein [Betaproteobacteria bacterium]
MKIAVVEDYANVFRSAPAYARLAGHEVVVYTEPETDRERLATKLADADIVVVTQQRTRFPRALIEKLPRLRFISQTGRNIGHLDLAACAERGIVVSAIGGAQPHATAELTWGLAIAALRRIPYESQRLRDGLWQSTVGTRLYGSTLGIYAYGRIGALVARVGAAFDMRVVCWGREGSTARALADGYEVATSREVFFAETDVLSLHLPLRDESTRGIVTARDLALMKPTAVLVNTSRAGIIEQGALVAALKAGRPGFAGIDVFDDEPVVGASDPLVRLPNAVCTPHLGYATLETLEHHYDDAVDQILAFVAGKPINVVSGGG